MDILESLDEVSLIVLVVNILFSIKILRVRPDLKWFEAMLILSFFIQVMARVFTVLYGNNLPLLHLYTLLEFIFISLFYYQILFKSFIFIKYFYCFLGVISSIIIYNSIAIEPITGFNSNAKGLTQIIIIGYAIFYFFNGISVDVIENKLVLSRINAAILLYYAGSLFIFVFAGFLLNNSPLINGYFWKFNTVLYIVFLVLILIATWKLVFPAPENSKDID